MRRAQLTGSLRQLADRTRHAFPETAAHLHIGDAASALAAGNTAGAQRHLNAAIATFTPQTIRRHGISDDTSHAAAKKLMGETHRHLLLVKDVSDAPDPATQLTAGPFRAIELAARARTVMGL